MRVLSGDRLAGESPSKQRYLTKPKAQRYEANGHLLIVGACVFSPRVGIVVR